MNTNKIEAYINPKSTGYTALAGFGLSVGTGCYKNKYINKAHKPLAYLTALTAMIHVGQIEYYHYKYKNKN